MENERTLLVVGGGIEAIPGICRAKEMGLRVAVSDVNPQAPGFAMADDQLLVSTYNVEGTVSTAVDYHHLRHPLSGVICVATDVPLTVAAVADALGLPGISLASARLAIDKLSMKDKFAVDGVPIPWYCPVSSVGELRTLVGIGDLLVIKPVDSRGARGVLRLIPGVDLDEAFNCARFHSPKGMVMVEKFLIGPQVSTESIVVDGEVFTIGFSDRNYSLLERYAPHIIEDGGELPSFLPEEVQSAVRETVAQAAFSLGIVNGVVKGDIVVHEGRPYVIELAARLSGGYFCSHEIPLNTGVDFVGAAIRLALGERPSAADLTPLWKECVSQRYIFPKPGRVRGIFGVEEVAARTGIELCEIRVKTGDVIGPIDSHPARAGMVIATGAHRKEALERAERAVAAIRIDTCSQG